MAELKHNFMKGRMNKDLDERLVPQGEYRHAVNVEVATSESSNMGSLQTLLGNTDLSSSVIDPRNNQTFFCVGSITDEKNDKLYWLLAGESIDVIAEYDYKTQTVSPVVIDIFAPGTIAHNESGRALNFDKAFLVTGINIIDDVLFWTDNNTEPKRINIPRCKMGSVNFTTQTQFYVRDNLTSINEIQYIPSGPIQHEHLTVIKKAPPTAPSLEMINTAREDLDEDSRRGELNGIISSTENIFINPATGQLYDVPISIQFDGPNYPDYKDGDVLTIKASGGEQSVRIEIIDGEIIQPGWDGQCLVRIISGNMYFASSNYEFSSELEQEKALFRFKFPRFAYRYKYEDGEYSTFSPFTEVAFLPDRFDYLPKEAYNLGMVNRLRNLVIKDFVDHRQIPDDVIAVDILYKESNSPNIYSVKTIKRTLPDPTGKYEEWNANSEDTILPSLSTIRTSGFVKITTEMIHAVLPSNQLLRPYDNVPRKALGQEIVGNRLVYGNYLQNYNLFNSVPVTSIALGKLSDTGVFSPSILDAETDINIEIKTSLRTNDIGSTVPEQYNPRRAYSYVPAKSIKTLRHYQIGVIYIDELGRETPVFSDSNSDKNSIYVNKDTADQQTKLKAQIFNTYPEWAKSFKFYIKETSGDYYNLAMDRWYDAEDGNIWLSFPSAERNKLDLDTYLILKKGHDSDEFISGPARYKVIAIENEAPQFVKTFEKPQPSIVDKTASTPQVIGQATGDGFPLDGGDFIYVLKSEFDDNWKNKLVDLNQGPLYEYRLRFKSSYGVSKAYEIKSIIELGTLPMPGTGTGAWKIVFKKSLGPDVNITSTDGSFATAVTNLELLLSKQEVLSKPEFQGRFFAKIKRDQFIDNFVATGFGTSSNYNVVNSITSQYINTSIPSAMNPIGYGNGWFGFDPGFGPGSSGEQKISISSDNSTTPFCAGGPGHGEAYWDHVSGQSDTTASNGWFIDKIEGFRPFFNSDFWYGHDFKSQHPAPRTNVIDLISNNCWLELTYLCASSPIATVIEEMAKNAGGNEDMGMQLCGTGEYNGGGTAQGYLGVTDMRGPFWDNDGFSIGPTNPNLPLPNLGLLQNMPASDFGRIPPASGIHGVDATNSGQGVFLGAPGPMPRHNIITLSKAGYGEDYQNNAYHLTSLSHISSNFNMPSATWAVDKVDEMDFINSITTPGSIWRWREDPGQTIYRTKTPPFPVSLPINTLSSSEWSFNQQDYMFSPGEKGVFLYNYANFGDYPVTHEHPVVDSSGNSLGSITHHNWVSQRMYNGCDPTTGSGIPTGKPEDGLVYHGNAGDQPLETSGGWSAPSINIGCPSVGINCTSSGTLGYTTDPHHRYPCNTLDWDHSRARRRRYTFYAESLQTDSSGQTYGIGEAGPHYYSPTNDSTLDAHFDVNGAVLTGTNLPSTPAPGIRNDGMFSGHAYPGGSYSFNSSTETTIPHLKKVDGSSIQSPAPGSVTWQVLSPYFSYNDENPASTNPAIWETEPKEEVDLDIYYEVGQTYPIKLDNNTNEQFLGPIHTELRENSYVTCYDLTSGTVTLDTHPGFPAAPIPNNDDIRVFSAANDVVFLSDVNGAGLNHDGSSGPDFPPINSRLVFTRANGSKTETTIVGYDMGRANGYILDAELHNYEVTLPWHNCYSFGNGVESDRIRDDFNQVTIDNGAKASTILEEPYLEERRSSGLIYSGIYNSIAGVNNLNQFIQAEKITKDLNPTYGSIQKLYQRNFTLTAFCEDRVLKILANKDALFNADGNSQLVSTNRVLGEAQPYAGEYGISKNPESFAVENFRAYFTDKSRGAVLRLSKDGLTPISDAGMHDWFSDNLLLSNRIYGSFDDRKKEYNISLDHTDFPITPSTAYQLQVYSWVLANCRTAPCDNSDPDHTWKPTNKITVDVGTNVQVGDLVKGVGVFDGAEILSIQNVAYDGINMLELELDTAGGIIDVASLGGPTGVTSITSGAGCVDCLGYWNTRLIFYKPSEIISTYTPPANAVDTTVSFSEINRGWVSFKSWTAENAISLNNSYYTIKYGDLWEHHTNLVRNNFYNIQSESSVTVMLNEQPGSVKSFQTLNYEGSQAKVTENLTDSGEYWDNYAKNGWYVNRINSDLQEGDIQEFKEKEGKWFSQLKGQYTEWTDDGTAGNLDGREFSFQGIGQAGEVSTPDGGYTSWDCQQNVPIYSKPIITGNEYVHTPGVNPSFINYWFMNWQDPTFNANYPPATVNGMSWIEMGPVDATFNPNPHYVNGVDNTNGHYMSLFGGEWANDTSTTIDGVLASTHPDYINFYNEYSCNMIDITSTSSSPGAYMDGHVISDWINSSTHGHCGVGPSGTPLIFSTTMYFVSLLQGQYGTFGGQLTVAKLNSGDLVWEQEFDASGTAITPIGVKDLINSVGSDLNLMVHHNQIAGSSMPSCVEIQGLGGAYADEPSCLSDVNSPCGLTGTSWECQPVTYACVNPNTGNNVIVQSGSSPDGHNRHGNHQTDCNLPQVPSGTVDAGMQEYLRWFFDVPSRQTFRFEDYVSQWCGTDISGGCINCSYFGWDFIQGDGVNTAPFYITPYVMPPKFYTALEIINYYSTWYPVYPGMNYTQFLDAVNLLFTSPDPDGRIGEQRFLWNINQQAWTCPCPYTNCSNPQLAVTSTGFKCLELLGSTTGPHPDEATCIANSPSCAPIAPCTGTPHDITLFKTDATDPSGTGTCNMDGDAYVSVILLNGASTWTVEYFDAAGTLIATDPNTYSGNTTSQSFVTFQTFLLAFPPGLIDGDYYVRLTDNFGCFTDTLFTIDCIAPQPCPSDPHVINETMLPATNDPICDNGVINVTVDIGAGPGGNPFGSTNWSIKWFTYDPVSYNAGTLLPTYTDPTVYTTGQTATWSPPDANRQWGYEICDFGGTQTCCNGLFGPVTPGCTIQPPTPHWSCCETGKPGYDAVQNGCVDYTNINAPTLVSVHDCFNDGSGGMGPNGPYFPTSSMCDQQCPTGNPFSYGCCTDPNGCNDVVSGMWVNVGTCYGENNTLLPFLGSDYSYDPVLTRAACNSSCAPVQPSYNCCPPSSTYVDPVTGTQVLGCQDFTNPNAPTSVLPGECYDPGNGLGHSSLLSDCQANCDQVYGCTDPTAVNYCPTCTIDDGSCIYPGSGPWQCQGAITNRPYYLSFGLFSSTFCEDSYNNNNVGDCIQVASPFPGIDFYATKEECDYNCFSACNDILKNWRFNLAEYSIPINGDQVTNNPNFSPSPAQPGMSADYHRFLSNYHQCGAIPCGDGGNANNDTCYKYDPVTGTFTCGNWGKAFCNGVNEPNNFYRMASKPFGLAASVNNQVNSGPLAPSTPSLVKKTNFIVPPPGDVMEPRGWNWQLFSNNESDSSWYSGYNNRCLPSVTQGGRYSFSGRSGIPVMSGGTGPNGPGVPNQNISGTTTTGSSCSGGIRLKGPSSSCSLGLESDGYFHSQVLTQVLVGYDSAGNIIEKLQAGKQYELRIRFQSYEIGGPQNPAYNSGTIWKLFNPGDFGFGPGVNQGKIWINTGHNATHPNNSAISCVTNSSTYDNQGPSNPGNTHCTVANEYWINNGVYTSPSNQEFRFYNIGAGCPQLIIFPSWFGVGNNTDDWVYTHTFTAIGSSGNTLSSGGHMNIEQLVIEFESYCEQSVNIGSVCIVEIPSGGGSGSGSGSGSGAISGPNTTTSSTY